MGHILLAALCLWSCLLIVTPLLNETQVGRVTDYIQRRFTKDFDYEYAYFVKFTREECNTVFPPRVLQEALKGEDADDMYNKVNDYEIYTGERMVASSYLTYHEHTSREYSLHAEYRLLEPDYHSPISDLLANPPSAGCAIFYSKYSPCVSKCLLPDGDYNIMEKLQKLFQLPNNKIFAFNEVFWRDKVNPSKQREEVWDSWETLNDTITLYRCTGNNCVQCFRNGVRQDACYDN